MKAVLALLLFAACASRIKVEPVMVQPIHVTVDVNVHEPPKPTADASR